MWILLRVGFDWRCYSTIAVAFANDRIDGTAEHLSIASKDHLVLLGDRIRNVQRHIVALGAQLGDACRQLRNACRDIWQLDYVGSTMLAQFTELGQRIALILLLLQILRELSNHTRRQRNVRQDHLDLSLLGERFDHWIKRKGR